MTAHVKVMAVISVLVLPLHALAEDVSPPQGMSAMPPAPLGPYYSIRINAEPPASTSVGGTSGFGFGFGNSFGGQAYGGMPYGRPFVPRSNPEPSVVQPQVQAPAPVQAPVQAQGFPQAERKAPSQVVTPPEVQPSAAPDWVKQRRADMKQRRAEAQKRFTMSAPQPPMYAPQGYGAPYAPYGYVQQQQFQPQPQYGAVQ